MVSQPRIPGLRKTHEQTKSEMYLNHSSRTHANIIPDVNGREHLMRGTNALNKWL